MILEEDAPEDANVISGSFVIIVKDVETENPTFKARFVAYGSKESEKKTGSYTTLLRLVKVLLDW